MLNRRSKPVLAALISGLLLSACALAPTLPAPAPAPEAGQLPPEATAATAADVTATPPAVAASAPVAPTAPAASPQSGAVLAKPGECYARVVSPPRFDTVSERVLAKAASERIEIIPALYETVEEKVLVKPAGKKIAEVIPPVYKTVEEQVLVKAASEKLIELPAVYKIVEDTQLVKPATTEWKKGRGPVEKVDGLTGEIMCLVTVPAEYRTVQQRVVVTPASVQRVPVPAEYATVQRQQLVSPARVREVETPAEYKTLRTLKITKPAEEKRIVIPAEYQTVTRQVLVSESTAQWKSILCETNTTPGIVQNIQRALLAKGFKPGAIDGVVGAETSAAIRAFQEANGLATGGLTMDTLDQLGVSRN